MAGSISYGLATAKNENILALSNINLDFSLVKFIPSPEYHGVGQSLSPRRRKEAEDGQVHSVARKLALLLCEDLPEIPNLLRAYGIRASKIAEDRVLNPRGSALDGVFQDHIGLDATSLWAAATSGQDTVALHLLACMLSRIWKHEAVAVWMELVERRKAALQARLTRNLINANDITASAIQLSREQLADWDASTRSWLASADLAFLHKQKQLILILDNLNIQIVPQENILESVTAAWKSALQFMEDIVTGKPMAVQRGEVLLAMSAWHLYPDLEIVLPLRKCIKQNDELIPHGGIVTIGLEHPEADKRFGVSWSLPLSYLQYYGKPVFATGSVNSLGSRISMNQLIVVAFGCAVGSWVQTSGDISLCARVIIALEKSAIGSDKPPPTWLTLLSFASKLFMTSSKEERVDYERLFAFGRRRASTFLSTNRESFPPWFNLCQVLTVVNLLRQPEDKVLWLRNQYNRHQAMNLPKAPDLQFAIIRYNTDEFAKFRKAATGVNENHHPSEDSQRAYYNSELEVLYNSWEFASLVPIYRGMDGNPSHRRWLVDDIDSIDTTRGYRLDTYDYHSVSISLVKRAAHINSMIGEATSLVPNGQANVRYGLANVRYGLELGSSLDGNKHMEWTFSHKRSLPSQPLKGSQFMSHGKCTTASLIKTDRNIEYRNHLYESTRSSAWTSFFSIFRSTQQNSSASCSKLLAEIQQLESKIRVELKSQPELASIPLVTPSNGLLPELAEPFESPSPVRRAHVSVSQPVDLSAWYIHTQRQEPNIGQRYVNLSPFAGDVHLYLPVDHDFEYPDKSFPFPDISPQELLTLVESSVLDVDNFFSNFLGLEVSDNGEIYITETDELTLSLDALHRASQLYQSLPDAQVELSITKAPLGRFHWAKATTTSWTRTHSFACITSFETGYIDCDPATMNDVMGVSVGNSLYFASSLLTDPYSSPQKSVVRRSIGNIGKSGAAFLISPHNLNIRDPEYDRWRLVQHAIFDGAMENNFPETSLHFSFTGYELPLNTGQHGLIDKPAYFLQAVIQAYERGRWVADLDLLNATMREEQYVKRLPSRCNHSNKEMQNFRCLGHIVTIDCWDELLDHPETIAIVRAKGNWLARLAVVAVAFQRKQQIFIANNSICWACVKEQHRKKDAIILC